MKGYVYLDNDQNLNFRDGEYIDKIDPSFWTRNYVFVDTVWKIDSEDSELMTRVLESFKNRGLRMENVKFLCQQIGFDLDKFLEEKDIKPTSGFSSITK